MELDFIPLEKRFVKRYGFERNTSQKAFFVDKTLKILFTVKIVMAYRLQYIILYKIT